MSMLKGNYFDSIEDIILWNWWEVQSGKLEYTRINVKKGTEDEDQESYIRINDSYIDAFGIDKAQVDIMELQRRIAVLQCDFVIEDNRFHMNEINRLQKEIVDILTRPNSGDRDGLVIHLEKWLGFRINEKEITANKFYKIVREFEREQEALAKAHS